jgi:hypothetical protein
MRTDRWRHRRRLVYAAVSLGILMIGSAILDFGDRALSSELVRGGVALISLVLSGYVFAATFDDKWSGDEPLDEYPADGGADGGGCGDGVGGGSAAV